MTAPTPDASSAQDYRDLNLQMADTILRSDPAPYADEGYVRRVVAIRGRRSGTVHQVPLAVVSTAGQRYLVSPTRDRNWVANLAADAGCTVRSRDSTEACTAVAVADPTEVSHVVHLYLALMNAPWAVARFPFPADADLPQIRQAAGQLAVFRLTPVSERVDHETS